MARTMKNVGAKGEDKSTQCPEHCPMDCFVLRLLLAIGTFAVLLLVLATAIHILDRFDIVHRSLDYFKPYATSLPWILMIVFTTLLLCIPSVTGEIKCLLDRVESIWTFKFRPKNDPDVAKEAKIEVEERKDNAGELTADKMRELVFRKITEIRKRKSRIVQLHEQQIQATLLDRNIGVIGSELHFDARYKSGRKDILAKAFPLWSSTMESFCGEFESLKEHSSSGDYILHILVYFRDTLSAEEMRNGIFKITLMASRLDFVKVYFYSVANDNSVAPLEDIP